MSSTGRKRLVPVLLVISAAIVAYVGLQATVLGGGDKYVVYAELEDAGGILKNYTVKVGGVDAGSVEQITLDEHDNVTVRIELDEGVGPIGAGAEAHVRPVNLLGEKYVDLDLGDQDTPLPSGATIPKQRTGAPTELDDVLNALDPDTRAGLRILINEAGIALAGRGADFNSLLEELPPALDEAHRFIAEIARESEALERLIVEGNGVVAAVDSRHDEFGELIESAGAALDTVAARRAELGETVRAAPGALEQLTTTLVGLDQTAADLTPAAVDLRAAIPGLASTLEQAPGFAAAATQTLTEVLETSPALERLGKHATPTLERLQPTAEQLATFSSSLDPLLAAADGGGGLREFLDFMDGWVGVIENADGLGHVFRLHLIFDEQFFTSGIDRYTNALTGATGGGSAEPAGTGDVAAAPDAPEETETGVDEGSGADGAPDDDPDGPLGPLLDEVEGVTDGVLDDVTGLLDGSHNRGGSQPEDPVGPLLDFLFGS